MFEKIRYINIQFPEIDMTIRSVFHDSGGWMDTVTGVHGNSYGANINAAYYD